MHDNSEEDLEQDFGTIQEWPEEEELPFAQIPNALLRDETLSPNCRWLIAYLLSNKSGWIINRQQVINHCKGFIGRNRVHELFEEALESGYMKREEIKKGNLKAGVKYYVSRTPKFKKCFRRPDSRDTDAGNAQERDHKNTIKKEDYKKEQQQQQSYKSAKSESPKLVKTVVAAVSSNEKISTCNGYSCLDEIDIPGQDKLEISNRYDEQTVKNAIAFATNPQTKITKGLVACIKWACANKPEIPKSIEEQILDNKGFVKKYAGAQNERCKVEFLNQYVEFIYLGVQKESYVIKYEDKDFKAKFIKMYDLNFHRKENL